jgi:hypothetical protein
MLFPTWITSNLPKCPNGLGQSTESPILFRSCGYETPFSDQKWASKFGDSVLWLGQRYEDILMQSPGNLPGGIDPKTRQSLVGRYVPRTG